MKKIKYILIISTSFTLILPDIFAEVAGVKDTAYVGCIGMSDKEVDSPYAKSPISCW